MKQWLARVREGVPEVEMIDGAKRYRAYCERMQLVATSYVMQPRRFFGTSRHFELPWEIEKPRTPWSINAAPLEKLRSHETTALGRDEAKTLMASLRSRFEGKQA